MEANVARSGRRVHATQPVLSARVAALLIALWVAGGASPLAAAAGRVSTGRPCDAPAASGGRASERARALAGCRAEPAPDLPSTMMTHDAPVAPITSENREPLVGIVRIDEAAAGLGPGWGTRAGAWILVTAAAVAIVLFGARRALTTRVTQRTNAATTWVTAIGKSSVELDDERAEDRQRAD